MDSRDEDSRERISRGPSLSEAPDATLGSAVIESIGAELSQKVNLVEVKKRGDDEVDVPGRVGGVLVQQKMVCALKVSLHVAFVVRGVPACLALVSSLVLKSPNFSRQHYHRLRFSLMQREIIASFPRGIFPSGNPDFFSRFIFFDCNSLRSSPAVMLA